MTQTEQHLSDVLRDLVAAQPFEPDRAAIVHRGLRLRRRAKIVRGVIGAGVVAVAAAVAVSATGMTGSSTRAPQATAAPRRSSSATPSPSAQLVSLAGYIVANAPQRTGDATLVLGEQSYSNGQTIPRADLFADNGTYYFAHTRSGLPAQVAGGHAQGNGVFTREVAAAVFAVNGDLSVARQRMSDAPLDPGTKRRVTIDPNTPSGITFTDNWVWGDSLDALNVGAGDPRVRAGVLRLLSTVHGVTVTHTTTNGQATLTLTAAGALLGDQQESLIINATTGIPVEFLGGQVGHAPSGTITYQVSRVTLADVAAGRF